MLDFNTVAYCTCCGTPVNFAQNPVQAPVYKLGELQYIELAHRTCVPEWAKYDGWEGDDPYTTAADESYWENQRWLEWCAQQEADYEAAQEPEELEPRQAKSCVPPGHLSELKYGSDHYNRRAYSRAERHAGKAWTRGILKEVRAIMD